MWDSKSNTRLQLLKKAASGMEKVATVTLPAGVETSLEGTSVDLAGGDELVLLPEIDGMFAGGDTTLKDFSISLGTANAATGWRLPLAWEGVVKGEGAGNPVGSPKPVWRLDQVWPDDPVMAANYVPLQWSGTRWEPLEHGAGGQPAVTVESGDIEFSVRGSWTGDEGQRIASLTFIAPENGTYHLTGRASSKPWEGQAATYRLGLFKKDTQRSAQQKVLELPRSGDPVDLDLAIDLTAGQELVILPLMPDWHNATNTRIIGLKVEKK